MVLLLNNNKMDRVKNGLVLDTTWNINQFFDLIFPMNLPLVSIGIELTKAALASLSKTLLDICKEMNQPYFKTGLVVRLLNLDQKTFFTVKGQAFWA